MSKLCWCVVLAAVSLVLGSTPLFAAVLAGGNLHSLALQNDGTVWTWGYNGTGQLGDGTTTDRYSPVQVLGLAGMWRLATGTGHSLALGGDGTVWAWGYNDRGQLGDGTSTQRNTPAQVPSLDNVKMIAAGNSYSLAVKTDGTVWTWGDNTYGQLGDGTTKDQVSPVQVVGLSDVIAVAGGCFNTHTLALKSDGTVWAWGDSSFGQLGDGTTTSHVTPQQVPGLSGIVAIAAGDAHSLALKDDGTVWAWGCNTYGQLGDDSTVQRDSPVQVDGLAGVTGIAASTYRGFSLAVRNDGTVWAWGWNVYGQLGDGTITNRTVPVQVVGLADVCAVVAGSFHSLAVKRDGTLWAWGDNAIGELGDGTTDDRHTPVQVPGLSLLVGAPLPVNPSPADELTDLPSASGLAWTGAAPGVTFDVYLDTVNPPSIKIAADQSVPSLPSMSLLDGRRYYWQVVSKYDAFETPGPVWSFATHLTGDIDADGAVILADLKSLVAAWNTTPASPNWNLNADIDGDGAVILADLKILVANWNRFVY